MPERLARIAVPAATGRTAEIVQGASIMKRMLVGAAMTLAALTAAGGAEAKGCIKGAIVGGIAGHYAGHHGLVGAAAGCAIGRHRANAQARQMDQRPVNPAAQPVAAH
jgi:hypothetical protein